MTEQAPTIQAPTVMEENYDLIDMLDDQQIMAELSGKLVDEYVYKFEEYNPDTRQKETKYKLSKIGTNWACREYAKRGEMIRVVGHPEVKVDPGDPEYILVTVIAERIKRDKGREIVMDNRVGAKRQWRKLKKRDGTMVDNQFWFEHAVAKAERNSKQALLEADFVKALIDAYLRKKGKVRDLTGSSQQQQAAPSQGAKQQPPPTQGQQKTQQAAPAQGQKPTNQAKSPKRETPAAPKRETPSKQPAAQKTDQAAPPVEEKNKQETRVVFFALLGNLGYKSEEAKKDAFHWYLPGYDSTRLVPESDMVTFINAMRDVLEGKNELVDYDNGTALVHRESQQVLYPKGFVGVPKTQPTESGKDPF